MKNKSNLLLENENLRMKIKIEKIKNRKLVMENQENMLTDYEQEAIATVRKDLSEADLDWSLHKRINNLLGFSERVLKNSNSRDMRATVYEFIATVLSAITSPKLDFTYSSKFFDVFEKPLHKAYDIAKNEDSNDFSLISTLLTQYIDLWEYYEDVDA